MPGRAGKARHPFPSLSAVGAGDAQGTMDCVLLLRCRVGEGEIGDWGTFVACVLVGVFLAERAMQRHGTLSGRGAGQAAPSLRTLAAGGEAAD